jgi:eukaryotic-like serine/threonine-protein kinase
MDCAPMFEPPTTVFRSPLPTNPPPRPSVEPSADPGLINNRYALRERIGSGGMGTVYKAWDARLGRVVAVKLIHRHLAGATDRRRFARELHTQAGLGVQPNVVPVFDGGRCKTTGALFVVMPYLSGETLAARLADQLIRPLAPSRALAIAWDVANGLAHVHEAGVIHRDVKPSNIFLKALRCNTNCVDAELLDFGVARSVCATDELSVTGSVSGTPAYMSVEQARGTKELDHRTDLCSLGIVLYEMLSGINPFRGADALETLCRLATVTPARLTNVPEAAADLVERLMAKDRDYRPSAAEAVAAELRGILRALPED